MIREWMLDNGNVKRYDTVTQTVEVVDRDGVNIEPVRPANADDKQQYDVLFPDVSIDKVQEISSMQSSIKQYLTNFYNTDLTTQSIENLNNLLSSGSDLTELYSNMSVDDFESTKLIISLIRCTNLVVIEIAKKINLTATTTRDAIISYEGRLQKLEAAQ